MKELKSPPSGLVVPATRRGLKGRTWPGQADLFGPEVRLINGLDACVANDEFQGVNLELIR